MSLYHLPGRSSSASTRIGTNMMRTELKVAVEAARGAGRVLLSHYGRSADVLDKQTGIVDHRSGAGLRDAEYDPVTQADREADTLLRELLLAAFPEYGWLSEETVDSRERLGREWVWIVDPIDGTKEFISQVGEFVTSIALVEEGIPVVAVMYNPVADVLYSALRGGGCFANGKRVFCTEVGDLRRAVLTVSRSEAARGEVDPLRPYVAQVRAVGSVAYKLAVVAAGEADLNVSVQPKNEWDVCAGDLLIREAGGVMLDLNGRVREYNQADPLIEPGLVAGNEATARHLLTLLEQLEMVSG